MLNIPSSVKALFQTDGVHKNFRVHFPNGEMADITNDNVVQESVKFTESLSSQSTFKFGLAEASVLEFETVGVGNMFGMTIEASIEIDTSSLSAADITAIQADEGDGTLVLAADSDIGYGFYRIPLGTFRVDSCPRDHQSMAHRQVTAYTAGINKTTSILMQEASLARWTAYIYHDLNPQDILAASTVGKNTDQLASLGYQATNITFPITSTAGTNSALLCFWYDLDGDNKKEAGIRLKQGTEVKGERFGGPYNNIVLTDGIVSVDYDDVSLDSQIKALLAELHQKYDSRGSFMESMTNPGTKTLYPHILYAFDYRLPGGSGGSWVDRGYDETLKLSAGAVAPFDGVPPMPQGATSSAPYYGIDCIPGSFTVEEVVKYDGNVIESIDHQITGGPITAKRWEAVSDLGLRIRIDPTLKRASGAENSFTGAVKFLDMIQGNIELSAVFAKTDRLGGFEQIHLDNSSPLSIVPGDYSEAWWDEFDVDPIGTVTVTFKDKDENGNDRDNTGNISIGYGQSVYDMTSNEFLKTVSDQTLDSITALIENNFKPYASTVEFTPIELDMQGWPWLEAGDALEVEAEDGTIVETYALRVEMSGIQNLQAVITAEGGEIIEEVE